MMFSWFLAAYAIILDLSDDGFKSNKCLVSSLSSSLVLLVRIEHRSFEFLVPSFKAAASKSFGSLRISPNQNQL